MTLNRTAIGLACEHHHAVQFRVRLDIDGKVVIDFVSRVGHVEATEDAELYEKKL